MKTDLSFLTPVLINFFRVAATSRTLLQYFHTDEHVLGEQLRVCCRSTTPPSVVQWADSLHLLTYCLAFMLLLDSCLQEFQAPDSWGCFMPWITSPKMSLQLQYREACACGLQQNWIFHFQTVLFSVSFNQVVGITARKKKVLRRGLSQCHAWNLGQTKGTMKEW